MLVAQTTQPAQKNRLRDELWSYVRTDRVDWGLGRGNKKGKSEPCQSERSSKARHEADSFEPAEWSERLTRGQSGWLGAAAVGSIPALALSLFLQRLTIPREVALRSTAKKTKLKNSNISQSHGCSKRPQTVQISSTARLQTTISQKRLRDISPFCRGPAHLLRGFFTYDRKIGCDSS